MFEELLPNHMIDDLFPEVWRQVNDGEMLLIVRLDSSEYIANKLVFVRKGLIIHGGDLYSGTGLMQSIAHAIRGTFNFNVAIRDMRKLFHSLICQRVGSTFSTINHQR